MPRGDDDIVELTSASPLRAQEIVEGLSALGIAARVHEAIGGGHVEPTGAWRVLVFRRDLGDARAALPAIGRDVIASALETCPACGHAIDGAPEERCPGCGLALPVPGRADPIGHFGAAPGGADNSTSPVLTAYVVIVGAVVVVLLIASVLW